MKRTSRLFAVLITLGVFIASQFPVDAAGYLYAGRRKTVNCGVVVVDGVNRTAAGDAACLNLFNRNTSANSVGDLFGLLDYRTDLKPSGWSLENPYAPVDATGKKCLKTDYRYWRVNLSSVRNLSRMHVLYLPGAISADLRAEDREKLRKFVDSGGVLWIDNAGSLDFSSRTFIIPGLKFYSAGGVDIPWSRHHPLLTMPFWLDEREITALGPRNRWCSYGCYPGYDIGGIASFAQAPRLVDVLYPIVAKTDGGSPSVAATTYGSGRIVATANYIGLGCFSGYPDNTPSLKFAYNVLAWASSWTDLRKNPRRSGASIDTVGGSKLIKVWSLPGAEPTGESGAVIYKNVVFYSSGSTLFALDVMPQEDLDHNGNPDDGFQGLPGGMADDGQDVIWFQTVAGETVISSPTVVTTQNPLNAGATVEAVLVMGGSGNVYMLDAFPHNSTTAELLPVTSELFPHWWIYNALGGAAAGATTMTNPPPPIFINGWAYCAGADGRIYGYNPALAKWNEGKPVIDQIPWQWCAPYVFSGTTATIPSYSAGPNFGFVSSGASGAVSGMLFWCTSNLDNVEGSELNDYVFGIPIYTNNDRLRYVRSSSNQMLTEYRINNAGCKLASAPAPIVEINGVMAKNVTANAHLAGDAIASSPIADRGHIVVETNFAVSADAMAVASYSLDYTTEEGIIVDTLPRVRAPLQPSANAANQIPVTKIKAMPALGPDNLMYLTGVRGKTEWSPEISNTRAGGSVYCIKSDSGASTDSGSGSLQQLTKWNYMLHSGLSMEDLQGLTNPTVPVPGIIAVKPGEGVVPAGLTMSDFMLQNPQPVSSPVVVGDKVFVTVKGTGSSSGSNGALLCFKANSDFVIRVNTNSGIGTDGKPIKTAKRLYDDATDAALEVKLWQPNLLRTGTGTGLGPVGEGVLVTDDTGMLDREKGTITFNSFDTPKLIDGLFESNTFSPSLPVWVLLNGVEVPIDWSTWGPSVAFASLFNVPPPMNPSTTESVDLSGWNNLLWYYVPPPPCSGISSSPVVIGNTVYFVTDDGILYALNAENGENSGGPVNPYAIGVDWKEDSKVVQWHQPIGEHTGIGAMSGRNVSPAGCNGVFVVPGPDGLYAYANPTTLIADTNRLVEVDGAGDVAWSLDSINVPMAVPGKDSTPRKSVPINKPSRARYMENGEILVVNTGSNMVCKTEKSGNIGVQRVSISGGAYGWIRMVYDKFTDPGHLMTSGQPTKLSAPMDALFWQDREKTAGGSFDTVIHCLIADSGNSRVVDLVYRFTESGEIRNPSVDPDSGYLLPALNWVSNTESKGERYSFECLQVVPSYMIDPTDLNGASIYAAISNFRVDTETPNPQGLGGAIVELNYRTRTSASAPWDYLGPGSGKIKSGCAQATFVGGVVQPLASPRYFQIVVRQDISGRALHMLICDNRGVYEVGPLGGNAPPVVHLLDDVTYRNMDRDLSMPNTPSPADPGVPVPQKLDMPFIPTSVHELPNGNWLIANSFAGKQSSGVFAGEVIEVTPGGGVNWCCPELKFEYRTVLEPYNYTWTQKISNSYILQQPRSAFRQF